MSEIRLGRVLGFEDRSGLGVVELDDGRQLAFHCTAIADGSRHVDQGARVACAVGAGHLGRVEARQVVPLAP